MTVEEKDFGLDGDVTSIQTQEVRNRGVRAGDAVSEALDTVRDITADQPLLMVAIAAGLGVLTGGCLARR
ncbi:hypothetical protein AA23498_1722 [Acetobacter nitrogenifigens DSM 23921 = NBRC 105050]|uniref:DUF883 domain-containing protein n=1 Tax=Acetobacter nitrogenifigens DSM 23921 = NBRC 105050 TaxID=1120919 RepID=A0A511X9E1_9PROT|nr:hypothetical protein [Acetobacter nitrogenifigens]GBQ93420.1 hypothetical protein AA23498_1722 [Acetobacter nitrogenifigens DSM 23921 = NBRC 105050]GEN59560.1 hypothetical protein ANI02nite_14440 [Acetobacter nitrogenifigens DSM 23921 = NBRC 105050]